MPVWIARSAGVGGIGLCVLWSVACRDRAPSHTGPLSSAAPATQQLTPAEPPAVGAAASAPRPEVDARLSPPDRPLQHLAFTEHRLALLGRDELIVRALPELRRIARVSTPGARNVVAGAGGDFIAVGSDHVYRLGSLDQRAEVLAPVPRLGPTTILPASDSSDHFWLLYEGIRTLPEFDLQETVITPYVSVLSWTELTGFDGRALSSRGDGSFVYTTPAGVRRRDAASGSREVASVGWAAQIWRLLPADGHGWLWAATPTELLLFRVGAGGDGSAGPAIRRRIELPPHPVALASRGQDVAVLAVERFGPSGVHLRIEVYARDGSEARVLRLEDAIPVPPDAGASAVARPAFLPELLLAPGRPWLAAFGFSLWVFDWRTGTRLFPPPSPSPTSKTWPRGAADAHGPTHR